MKENTAYLNELIATFPTNDYVRVAEKVKKARRKKALKSLLTTGGSILGIIGFIGFAFCIAICLFIFLMMLVAI